jgi:hypothetical protein
LNVVYAEYKGVVDPAFAAAQREILGRETW